jgi:hypothetical protein
MTLRWFVFLWKHSQLTLHHIWMAIYSTGTTLSPPSYINFQIDVNFCVCSSSLWLLDFPTNLKNLNNMVLTWLFLSGRSIACWFSQCKSVYCTLFFSCSQSLRLFVTGGDGNSYNDILCWSSEPSSHKAMW